MEQSKDCVFKCKFPAKRTEDVVLKSDFAPGKISAFSKQIEKSQMILSK